MKLKNIITTLLFTPLLLQSCIDKTSFMREPEFSAPEKVNAVSTSGLIRNTDGSFTPTCRIPLVGEGRIINELTKSAISVLSSENHLSYVTDTDLSNSVSFSGVAGVSVGEPIMAIRDIYRTYKPENGKTIKAGFVMKVDKAKLLDANIIGGFWVETYLKGVKQETNVVSDSGGFGLLQLGLLSTADGNSEIEIEATKEFDEIRLGNAKLTIDLLSGMEIFYGYVGENEEKIAAEGQYYGNATADSSVDSKPSEKLTDSNLENYCSVPNLLILQFPAWYTVDFGANIPAGSTIGFKASGFELASIPVSLSGSYLQTFDENDQEQDKQVLENGISVSVLGGSKTFYTMTTTKDAQKLKIYFPGGVKLFGNTKLYYAFMREPVKVDISSYFNIGDDTTADNIYTLPTDKKHGGTVEYVLLQKPADAATAMIEGNRLINMSANGDYTVQVIYTRNGETYIDEITVTRNQETATEGCNITMTNTATETNYSVEGVDGGALVNIFIPEHDAQNLIDENTSNYAECVSVLNLIEHRGLVAINSNNKINSAKEEIRTGFVLQNSAQLLGANALKFFYIRLLDGDKEVFSGMTDENNTVKVGLLGNDATKVKFSIETSEQFDRIELWSAGLLNLNLNSLRMYYAFYEPVDCSSSSSLAESCTELITAQKDGATINYENSKLPSIAVGTGFMDLGHVIDNDITSAATIAMGVNAINASTLAISFNEMPANQPVGVIFEKPTNLTSIDILQDVRLTAYHTNSPVADNSTGGSLADIDLIGGGGYIYLEVTPTGAYDEARVSFPAIANVGESIKVYGFYTKADKNGNGVPDCIEDNVTPNPEDNIYTKSWTKHTCIDPTSKKGAVDIYVDGAEIGQEVTFTCYPMYGGKETVVKATAYPDKSGGQIFTIELPVGYYAISGLPQNGLETKVHALQTTWKPQPQSTDWTDWNNWTDGSPWGCTDVVIPANAGKYPELKRIDDNDFEEANCCRYIHFEPGAEVVNTHYLEYERAFVETFVTGGTYQNFSAPLKGMVTGDMFVSNQPLPIYFTELTSANYPEIRINPRVFQRMWSKSVVVANGVGNTENTTIAAIEADWSKPFNAVAEAYSPGEGFSMKIGTSGASYRLRFPKKYTTYNYYNLDGQWVKEETRKVHTGAEDGRFIYEPENFVAGTQSDFTFTLHNEIAGTEFIAGNPFMTHIDIQQFLALNPEVSAVRIDRQNGSSTIITLIDGVLAGTNGIETSIAPMQSFFASATVPSTTLNVYYSETMLKQEPTASAAQNLKQLSGTATQLKKGMMQISLTVSGQTSGCLLYQSGNAKNSAANGEDVYYMYDSEIAANAAIYSIADNKALCIQKFNNLNKIGIGMTVRNGKQGTMTLKYNSSWRNWILIDKLTDKKYTLTGNSLKITVDNLSSNSNRFYLQKQ